MRFVDVVEFSISWMLGGILAYSGVSHVINFYYFLGSVYGYRIVGPFAGELVAVVIPVLELLLASCLIFRHRIDEAHLLTFLMFVLFTAAQIVAYSRGIDTSCGCFGTGNHSTLGLESVTATVGLLLMSLTANVLRYIHSLHKSSATFGT